MQKKAHHKECNMDQDMPMLPSMDYETAYDICTVISASGTCILEDHVTDIIHTGQVPGSAHVQGAKKKPCQ